MKNSERPLTIAMLALGGQGGGVLTKWLVDVAQSNQYLAQSTYIAGVAQRTGATVYCVEMIPANSTAANGRSPVFTPTPIPGDVDLVIASEMAEVGRAILRGFVTPKRSTLIASSHRVYSINEKSALGDGIMDQSRVWQIATELTKQFIAFDMQDTATEAQCAISAVLFGAIAGSGALPFERQAFESTIRNSGRAVESNLRGFAMGYERAIRGAPMATPDASSDADQIVIKPEGPNGTALVERVYKEVPEAAQSMASHGALRCLEYQDVQYAQSYLDIVQKFCRIDQIHGGVDANFSLSAEIARQLALQMCYEDTIRVADLKTRGSRFEKIRQHVAAEDNQPVHVVEYFHPRLEEFCDTLPAALGAFVLRSSIAKKILSPFFGSGRNIKTTSVSGFMLLYFLSGMRRFRRGSMRYKRQQEHIDSWLARVEKTATKDYQLALSLAHSIEIVKGYGDTYDRGLHRYEKISNASDIADSTKAADIVRRLHRAALADEKGNVFDMTLATLEAENELV